MNSTPRRMRGQELRILLLESFYGGSHRDVADGLVGHSRHSIDLLTLPARFWKWRMRGASLWFVDQIRAKNADDRRAVGAIPYDLILCTGLMDVASLKALIGPGCPPILLYCHETQLAYPQPDRNDADLHFAFTDLVNTLVADRVLFNSDTHRRRYLDALPAFLRRLPEYRPMWSVDAVAAKSATCYPGITLSATPSSTVAHGESLPLIIWNHRWEFDKAPGTFFAALRELADRGCEFQVALLGENFNTMPKAFSEARRDLGDRILQYGYVADRAEYHAWLARGTVVVSTAIQENFGIAVMEAVAHGCHPILPNRLSYPEIIPAEFHGTCLYSDQNSLTALLEVNLGPNSPGGANGGTHGRADPKLIAHARTFEWSRRIGQFDDLIDQMIDERAECTHE